MLRNKFSLFQGKYTSFFHPPRHPLISHGITFQNREHLDSNISEMVHRMLVYWGNSQSLHTWSGAPQGLQQPCRVQPSCGSKRPEYVEIVWQSLLSPYLWWARTKRAGNPLRTSCLMRSMLHNSNARAWETHPDSVWVDAMQAFYTAATEGQEALSQKGTFLTAQNVRQRLLKAQSTQKSILSFSRCLWN